MIRSHYRLAFLLSVLVFLILGLLMDSLFKIKEQQPKPKSKVIKISLLSPVKPTIVKPIAKVVKPTPEVMVKKIVKPKPKKKPIVHKPKPKKIIKKSKPKPKPKPKPKKIIKKPKKIIKKVEPTRVITQQIIPLSTPIYVEPKVIVKPVIKPKPILKESTTNQAKNNEKAKKAFLNNILQPKIRANKKYPKIALRRHIESDVKVRFDITKQGMVTNIRFLQGKRIFQKSIRKTLNKTFPLNIPSNVQQSLPILDVTIVLHFNIR